MVIREQDKEYSKINKTAKKFRILTLIDELT